MNTGVNSGKHTKKVEEKGKNALEVAQKAKEETSKSAAT
jgi:hypothetical protein